MRREHMHEILCRPLVSGPPALARSRRDSHLRPPEPGAQRQMSVVGQSVKRKDGIGKATGRTRYADDLVFPGMLHARTIRSTVPRGRVRSIKLDFDTAGFVICDWRDVPGRNIVALIEDDQPCLVERDVRHLAEPILLLAHEDRERLLAARVEIEYERDAEPVFDPLRSERALKKILIEKGDLARG